ncbi:MAG: hypothetical protein J6P14_01225 [Ruminococcus sp.]|nr:hypothetical protein [Ruminococcus sp.]
MNDIFTEKTIGSISGVELKKKITAVADECYSNEDYQSAAEFYRTASEIIEGAMYKQIVEYKFSGFDDKDEKRSRSKN